MNVRKAGMTRPLRGNRLARRVERQAADAGAAGAIRQTPPTRPANSAGATDRDAGSWNRRQAVNRGREIHEPPMLRCTTHVCASAAAASPGNERFGLGPFFRIEPLGMEYIASVLEARGHQVTLADLRFSRPLERQIAVARPQLVGIAAMHALETDDVLALARRVRQLIPSATIVVGGHTAAAYPSPFLEDPVDAVVLDDGERAVAAIAEAVQRGRALRDVPGLAVRDSTGQAAFTPADPESFELDDVPLPARHHVAPWPHTHASRAASMARRKRRGCRSVLVLDRRLRAAQCAGNRSTRRAPFCRRRRPSLSPTSLLIPTSRSLALALKLPSPRITQGMDLVQAMSISSRQASLLEAQPRWRGASQKLQLEAARIRD